MCVFFCLIKTSLTLFQGLFQGHCQELKLIPEISLRTAIVFCDQSMDYSDEINSEQRDVHAPQSQVAKDTRLLWMNY